MLFWFHIVLLTAGVYLVSSGTNVKNVITFIFVLAIICALYLGWDGYHGYNNYRRFSGKVQIKTTKKKLMESKIYRSANRKIKIHRP